jgi:CHAT domain-containing protein
MDDESSDAAISAVELGAHLRFVERAMEAAQDDTQRRAALADGLLAFGDRFVWTWGCLAEKASRAGFFQDTAEEVRLLHISWMKGKNLTSRADEPDRRALAALHRLDAWADLRDDLTHYAATAVLALPDSHPLRDVDKVRTALRAQLLRYQASGEDTPWVFAALALGLAYKEQFGTDEELIAWEPWAEQIAAHLDPPDALRLWGSIESFYLDLAERKGPQWREHAARARSRIDSSQLSGHDRALSDVMLTLSAIADNDQLQAAEQLKQALDADSFEPHVQRGIAVSEARVRLAHNDDARVIELLQSRIGEYEEEYVTSIRAEDRLARGDEHQEACTLLAFALARAGQWGPSVEALERGKCARQRYTRAIRRTPAAAQLLELEADLYAMSRRLPLDRATPIATRVEDWLAHGVPPEAQLQEQYRRVIPALDPAAWKAPRLADIQSGLREGEAALSLGLSWPGLLGAVIARDRPACLQTMYRPDVTEARLVALLSDSAEENGQDGFLIALERGSDEAAQRTALDRLLAFLDEIIGRPVAEVLREHGLTRLVVIPHRFLRLTPLWALPSWVDFDVRMAPDASSLSRDDTARATWRRTALVVSNPTLDLALAPTEGAITTSRLTEAGFAVRVLNGGDATEDGIAARLGEVSVLHFAGHGHAALTDGSLSALLVSPEWSKAQMAGPETLVALANDAPDAPHLTLDQDEGSPRRKIYYDYAKRGTFFADVAHDEVSVAGELWRAGDILVQGSLEGCGLAFLCACSSGLGAIDALDEASGLPAALDLAGVRSVVSTGWPVADALALLFADEFYARLLPNEASAVDVVAAVRGAAGQLRTMERGAAADRVDALSARASGAAARFRLRAFGKRLRAGPEHPFAHPFEWGAFYATGAAVAALEA